MNNNEIIAYQREIINTIMLEEFNAKENNKKLELLEEVLKKSYLFSKIQKSILLKAKNEIELARGEGCYECWIASESFLETLTDEEKSEMIEILGSSPLIVDLAYIQLKKLEEKFLLRRIV